MRLERRTSHRHTSSSIAAASEAAAQPTSPDYMAASGAMTPATLLARTYSGPTVVAAITAASTGRKMQQRAALLQRISADAISVRMLLRSVLNAVFELHAWGLLAALLVHAWFVHRSQSEQPVSNAPLLARSCLPAARIQPACRQHCCSRAGCRLLG